MWRIIALAVAFSIAAAVWVGSVARESVLQQHIRRHSLDTDQLSSDFTQALSMKIRHVAQIVQGLRPCTETERATKNLLAADLGKLRWCLRHNNARKLDKTLRRILLMCRIVVPETPGFKEALDRIDYRIRDVLSYVLRNSAKPGAYGRRYRKGQFLELRVLL